MHALKKIVSYVQQYLQHIPFKKIRNRVGTWLQRHPLFLGLLLLGLIVLQLTLGRPRLVTLQGTAMGTHYSIKYLDRWGSNYQAALEMLLADLQQALSISLPDSELSRFNEHDCSAFYLASPCFYTVFAKSKEVYRNTAGAFDPTILPLVNAWGESPAGAADLDSLQLNTLRKYVSLDYVVANEQRIKKLKEGVQLDFRGMLKGYAVDQIAALLRAHGIEHAWIALGNEIVAHGKQSKHQFWPTAIHPYVASLVGDDLQITMELVDKAVAISRKQAPAGARQACIIDPATGYPAQHTLLAAVVVAQDCITADAYATALMVRGLVDAQELVAKQADLAALLIYEDDNGAPAFYASAGLRMQQNAHSITLQLAQEPS